MNDGLMIGMAKEFSSQMVMSGRLILELTGLDGRCKEKVDTGWNTLTESCGKMTADAMSDRGETQLSHMSIGTTSGGKTTASNALEAEVERNALDSTTQGAGANDNDVVFVATFGPNEPAAPAAVVEAGLFNHAAAGDMYAYQEFAAINKGVADTLTATWTVSYGSV